MLAGERFSDRPASVCPVIGAILRVYNDNTENRLRADLYRYAAEAVGTRSSYTLQRRRAELALAWASEHQRARRRRRRRRSAPDPDWSPDLVAEHVVGSLGRRVTVEDHAATLALLDELIALGCERELVEQFTHPAEDSGSDQQLLVAEFAERGAPAGLDLLPAALDHRPAPFGERGLDDALVAV